LFAYTLRPHSLRSDYILGGIYDIERSIAA